MNPAVSPEVPSEPGSALPTSKDVDFYDPKGDIVLAVGVGRENGVLFRVFHDQLARQSEVFSDMRNVSELADPSGVTVTQDVEMVDGCCVVRMEDVVEDVKATLDLLWNVPPLHPTFDSLLGILRVSTKYIMTKAREWAIHHLEVLFPSGPAQLLDQSHFQQWRKGNTASRLILISHCCDTPTFLPYAYYALASSEWTDRRKVQEIGLSLLDQEHLMMIAVGRAYLQRELGKKVATGGTDFVDYKYDLQTCTQPEVCIRVWTTHPHLLQKYVACADLLLWIKESRTKMLNGEWRRMCGGCGRSWARQADAKIIQVFSGFCSVMELALVPINQ